MAKRSTPTSGKGKGTDFSVDRISIGRHVFAAAAKSRLQAGDYTEDQVEGLEWLWGYAFNELDGRRSLLCEAIGYDWSVVFKIYTGKYGASIAGFCEAITHLRAKAAQFKTGFVRTVVTDRIFEALDCARDENAMVLICGDTGRSKTTAVKEWSRSNNHGRSVYVRCLSNLTRRQLVHQICGACGIGVASKKTTELEQRLLRSFSWKQTLIVDEAGHILPREGRGGTSAVEFLRDLHDICQCGVALVITYPYLEELREGRCARFFEQFRGRLEDQVVIPIGTVFEAEAEAVCQAFTPSPSREMLGLALRYALGDDGKLRALFKVLKHARRLADDEGVAAETKHLAQAIQLRRKGGQWPDR